MQIKIVVLEDIYHKTAQCLSKKTGFAVQDYLDNNCFCLVYDETIYLSSPKSLNLRPLSVDFNSHKIIKRCQNKTNYQQNIIKAIGIKANNKPLIIDATAGLAQDALLMASVGCQVWMMERNLIIIELLKAALIQGSRCSKINQIITNNLKLLTGDANQLMVDFDIEVDVIYLDPMFPNNKKRRKSNRQMQYFKNIVGSDYDVETLFLTARKLSPKRIVVKRSVKDNYISNTKPTHQIIGKTTRYDVYINI